MPRVSTGRKVKCAEGPHMVPEDDIHYARHFGGGSYKRPGRMYDSSICTEHVLDLAPRAFNNPSGNYVGGLHWSEHGIQQAARRLGWQGPVAPRRWQREEWARNTD